MDFRIGPKLRKGSIMRGSMKKRGVHRKHICPNHATRLSPKYDHIKIVKMMVITSCTVSCHFQNLFIRTQK